MSTHTLKIIVVVILASAGAAWGQEKVSAEAPFRLLGDTDAVWVILPADKGPGYKLAAKVIDGKKSWQCVGSDRSGDVAAAAAVGDSLVVFFFGGGQMRYFPHRPEGNPGDSPPQNLWPKGTKPLAACKADDGSGAVLVLVNRPIRARPTTTRSTTAPKGPPLSHSPAVLRYTGQKWRQVAVVPAEFAKPPGRAILAADRKATYVLLDRPRPALMAMEAGKWRRIALPAGLADARPMAMTVIDKALVLATFDSGQVSISKFASDKWSPPQPVRRGEKPATWPADAAPAVGRFGTNLAFAWKQDDKWLFAACGADGQLKTDTVDIFARAGEQELIARVQNIFFMAVFGMIVVLMFWPGQALRTAPFALPAMMAPARFSKRLTAACIDTLPFVAAASAVGLRGIDLTSITTVEGFREALSTLRVLYAFLGFLVVYPAYCFVMEQHYSATVGKMILHLRIVGDAGRPATLREVALRNISKAIEILGLPLVFPLLFPLLTRYRQRLGDKIAWTAVIDTEISLPSAHPSTPPLDDARDKPEKTDKPEQDK